MKAGCFWVLALGFVALVVYSIGLAISEGDALFEGPGDYAFVIIAAVIVVFFIFWFLNKKGIIRNTTEKRIENSTEIQNVLNHISDKNTIKVFIGYKYIYVYDMSSPDPSYIFDFGAQGFKLDTKGIHSLASYIGKYSFGGRFVATDSYKTDYYAGSGRLTGFTPTATGSGYVANYDNGYESKTFSGVWVLNTSLKDKNTTPQKASKNKKLF